MGVPSFYKWLVSKYPKVVVNAVEDKGDEVDFTLPNPNAMEFDNLYLDMNGIIHPCFHPQNLELTPTTFIGVFNSINEYIDHLFGIVRPRKLLFMAIDGVAPRSKMNQQRSRRFRTCKENEDSETLEQKLRDEFMAEGKQVLPKVETEVHDSNIITPGTKFLYDLSNALQSYIQERLKNHPAWKNIKVILSDANVPGEGEHKIMSFIRNQRSLPGYDPNTLHCLYGLDADLIMLALATHEVNFSILREDLVIQEQIPMCQSALDATLSKAESVLGKSSGWFQKVQKENGTPSFCKKPYQFLHIWILREYLELDMEIRNPPPNFKFDIERIVDDFIFICFFTGNDFLPHMPTLEIHEGAIDLLMAVYKNELKNIGGYLVDMSRTEEKHFGFVKLKRVEKFILLVGSYEDRIFEKRAELRNHKLRRVLAENLEAQEEENGGGDSEFSLKPGYENSMGSWQSTVTLIENVEHSATEAEILMNTKELREKLKAHIQDKADLFKTSIVGLDNVKLGSPGYKERYYKYKFCAESPEDIEAIRKDIVEKYTEGLCWVILYYFSGVPSWTWFYPYYYGPFASDLKGLAHVKVKFQKGLPFKPLDQLMAVLPSRSAHALPKLYQPLMTKESNIFDFYPSDFEVDCDGKRFLWQGISKLPFIEEDRLLSETRQLENELEPEETARNVTGEDKLFLAAFGTIISVGLCCSTPPLVEDLSRGSNHNQGTDMDGNESSNILCIRYNLPDGPTHIPRALIKPPEKTVTEADIAEVQLWHGHRFPTSKYHIVNYKKNWGHQTEESNTKANTVSKSVFLKSEVEVIHTSAGRGRGFGRGNRYPTNTTTQGNSEYSYSSSLGRDFQGGTPSRVWRNNTENSWGQNINSPTSQGRTAWSNSWVAAGSSLGEPRGFDSLKISETNRGNMPFGRSQPQPGNNNFCGSRNQNRTNDRDYSAYGQRTQGQYVHGTSSKWISRDNNTSAPETRGNW